MPCRRSTPAWAVDARRSTTGCTLLAADCTVLTALSTIGLAASAALSIDWCRSWALAPTWALMSLESPPTPDPVAAPPDAPELPELPELPAPLAPMLLLVELEPDWLL